MKDSTQSNILTLNGVTIGNLGICTWEDLVEDIENLDEKFDDIQANRHQDIPSE